METQGKIGAESTCSKHHTVLFPSLFTDLHANDSHLQKEAPVKRTGLFRTAQRLCASRTLPLALGSTRRLPCITHASESHYHYLSTPAHSSAQVPA